MYVLTEDTFDFRGRGQIPKGTAVRPQTRVVNGKVSVEVVNTDLDADDIVLAALVPFTHLAMVGEPNYQPISDQCPLQVVTAALGTLTDQGTTAAVVDLARSREVIYSDIQENYPPEFHLRAMLDADMNLRTGMAVMAESYKLVTSVSTGGLDESGQFNAFATGNPVETIWLNLYEMEADYEQNSE